MTTERKFEYRDAVLHKVPQHHMTPPAPGLVMQYALIALAWVVLIRWTLRFLRWSTRLPIPGREQDVRDVMNRSVGLDVSQAVRHGGRW